jgi:hypothetical protein
MHSNRLLFYPIFAAVMVAAIILYMVLPFQVSISTHNGFLSLNINSNEKISADTITPNVLSTVAGDTLTPTDLSAKTWISNTKVGVQLQATTLPKNVEVFGKPLISGTNVATLELQSGGVAYYRDGSQVFQLVSSITSKSGTEYIFPPSKTADYAATVASTSLSYSGTQPSGLPVNVGIWGSPNKDEFGLKVSFTPATEMNDFTYDYNIITSEPSVSYTITTPKDAGFDSEIVKVPMDK